MKLPQLEAKFNKSTGILDLSMCDLKEVSCLKKLSNSKIAGRITKIDLSDNAISEMPDELDFFPEKMHTIVKELDLSSNKFTAVPRAIAVFSNLQRLTVASNNISELSVDVFGRLEKLSYLDVTRNNSLDDRWKKALSTGAKHNEMAALVKEYALPEYKKLAKSRVKKQKQAEKKQEKARLAEKARQKDIRRQAWEEKQRRESEEAMAGGDHNRESDTESELEYPTASEDSEDEASALINPPKVGEKKQGLVGWLIGRLFYLVFMTIWTVFKYSFLLVASVAVSLLCSYGMCVVTGQTGRDSMAAMETQICPLLADGVHEVQEVATEMLMTVMVDGFDFRDLVRL